MRIKKIDGRKFVELENEKDEDYLKAICAFYSSASYKSDEREVVKITDFAVKLEKELEKK